MTTHSGHDEKSVTPDHPDHKNAASDSRKSSEDKVADDGTSKTILMRKWLNRIANYVIVSLTPAAAVLALIIAVTSVSGNRTSQTQPNNGVTTIESLSASLSATKDEMEKLKASMAHEKAKQEELVTRIIQNVTELQVIMHISPTLGEELHLPDRASAVTPSVSSGTAAPATVPDK